MMFIGGDHKSSEGGVHENLVHLIDQKQPTAAQRNVPSRPPIHYPLTIRCIVHL